MTKNEKLCFFCEKVQKVQEKACSFNVLTAQGAFGCIFMLYVCLSAFFDGDLADSFVLGWGVLDRLFTWLLGKSLSNASCKKDANSEK